MSERPLADRICLVAGASRGVGRGIARGLGEAGATVIVTARSSEAGQRTEQRLEVIEDTAREVDVAGGKGHHYVCDHRSEREVEALIAWTLRRFGRLDCVVSSVWSGSEGFDGERYADGTHWGASFWRRPVGPLAPMMETGFYAALLLARAAAPAMVHQSGGLMVFVGFDAQGAFLGDAHYDLAMSAVNRLAFVCGEELRPHNVCALALSPGRVRTERAIDAGLGEEAGETPLYAGRAVAALAADADIMRHAGRALAVGDLARVYGFRDRDGAQPARFVPN